MTWLVRHSWWSDWLRVVLILQRTPSREFGKSKSGSPCSVPVRAYGGDLYSWQSVRKSHERFSGWEPILEKVVTDSQLWLKLPPWTAVGIESWAVRAIQPSFISSDTKLLTMYLLISKYMGWWWSSTSTSKWDSRLYVPNRMVFWNAAPPAEWQFIN